MTVVAAQSYRQVLRERRLTGFLSGDVVSKVGDGMIVVALPLQTLRLHGGVNPALAIALVEAAPFALAVPVSLYFGLGRRRFRPRALVVADCVLRSAVFIGVATLALTQVLQLWVLVVALLCGSGLRLLASSGRRLIATGMAGPDRRFAVNGLLGTSDSVAAYVAGPVLGGLLATVFSPGVVLLADGLTFLVLLAAVRLAVPVGPGARIDADAVSGSGWATLRRAPTAARLFVVVFFFNLLYMPVEVALPLLVRGPLHASGGALGLIWTCFGAGALVGALATNHLRRLPQAWLLVAIIAGWASCVGLLAVASSVAIAATAFGIGGLIYAPFTPVAYSLVQGALRDDEQQPVLTLWAAGAAIAAPVGLLLGGPLVGLVGVHGGIAASAILTLALVPFAAAALRPRATPASRSRRAGPGVQRGSG